MKKALIINIFLFLSASLYGQNESKSTNSLLDSFFNILKHSINDSADIDIKNRELIFHQLDSIYIHNDDLENWFKLHKSIGGRSQDDTKLFIRRIRRYDKYFTSSSRI